MKSKLFQKILAICLCVSMVSSLCVTASATSTDSYDGLTYEELQECARNAKTQEEADAIFAALLSRFQSQANSYSLNANTRAIADTYVAINSTSVNAQASSVTIRYTVLAILPSGASLTIGYEYPAALRQSAKSFTPTNVKGGPYTKTLTSCPHYIGARIYGKFMARDYSETVTYKNFFDDVSTSPTTIFHTVTADEHNSRKWNGAIAAFSLGVAGPVEGMAITMVGVAVGFEIAKVDYDGTAPMDTGTYYKVTTYFSGDYLHLEVWAWESRTDYGSKSPIFHTIKTAYMPHF